MTMLTVFITFYSLNTMSVLLCADRCCFWVGLWCPGLNLHPPHAEILSGENMGQNGCRLALVAMVQLSGVANVSWKNLPISPPHHLPFRLIRLISLRSDPAIYFCLLCIYPHFFCWALTEVLLSSRSPSPFAIDKTSHRKKTQCQRGLLDGCVPLGVKAFFVFECNDSYSVVLFRSTLHVAIAVTTMLLKIWFEHKIHYCI